MGRKRIYRKTEKQDPKKPVRIGLLSAEKGSGLTHICLLLANYISGCKKRRVALLEQNQSGDFMRLADFYGIRRDKFTIQGVDYYSDVSGSLYRDLYALGYEYILSDYGSDLKNSGESFWQSEVKILLISSSPWKAQAGRRILDANEKSILESWYILQAFGSERYRKKLERIYGFPIGRIPFSEDPFSINAELYDFFRSLNL